jgi:hypothetical protein
MNQLLEQQFQELVTKLKGKSVYTNLELIAKGKCKTPITEIIGVSSLLTHGLIELEKNKKYKLLVSHLYEKLGELLYRLE